MWKIVGASKASVLYILAFEHALMCVLGGSSIFYVMINNLHLL